MIGYAISRAQLEQRIEAERPGWLRRAKERTDRLRAAGKYDDSSPIWSEIQPVFMKLQGESKCAFCERKLESRTYGKGEQAVEHFRPKKKIKSWKPPASLRDELTVTNPPPGAEGYFLLAYDVFNYSASCSPCNSGLKRGYFPVEGNHELDGSKPEDMLGEKPLLLYPIGDFEEDPENLIHFHGISAQASARSGYRRRRALVTIEFFKLDSLCRKNLLRERAMVILALYPAMHALSFTSLRDDQQMAQDIVDGCTAAHAPHANCARSFQKLYRQDPDEAGAIFRCAADLMSSIS